MKNFNVKQSGSEVILEEVNPHNKTVLNNYGYVVPSPEYLLFEPLILTSIDPKIKVGDLIREDRLEYEYQLLYYPHTAEPYWKSTDEKTFKKPRGMKVRQVAKLKQPVHETPKSGHDLETCTEKGIEYNPSEKPNCLLHVEYACGLGWEKYGSSHKTHYHPYTKGFIDGANWQEKNPQYGANKEIDAIMQEHKPESEENEAFLLHLVDIVWGTAHEDESIPSTDWAKRMVIKAKETVHVNEGDNVTYNKIIKGLTFGAVGKLERIFVPNKSNPHKWGTVVYEGEKLHSHSALLSELTKVETKSVHDLETCTEKEEKVTGETPIQEDETGCTECNYIGINFTVCPECRGVQIVPVQEHKPESEENYTRDDIIDAFESGFYNGQLEANRGSASLLVIDNGEDYLTARNKDLK